MIAEKRSVFAGAGKINNPNKYRLFSRHKQPQAFVPLFESISGWPTS
jgi:hypothetical protein